LFVEIERFLKIEKKFGSYGEQAAKPTKTPSSNNYYIEFTGVCLAQAKSKITQEVKGPR
jgi:hypothetical protein